MPNFYGFWGNPYRGNIGAIVSAPNGWVVDAGVSKKQLEFMLCTIHPMEFTAQQSADNHQFMYFQVYPTFEEDGFQKTIEAQDEAVLKKDKDAKINYWEEGNQGNKTLYRQIDYHIEGYTEFTGFAVADDFFAYCVCAVPKSHIPDDLARLRYIMSELHLIKISGIEPTDSHKHWRTLIPWSNDKKST